MVVCSVLPLNCAAVLFCAAAAAANCPALVLGNREDTPAQAATLTKSRHHSAPLMALHKHCYHKKKRNDKARTLIFENPESGLVRSWCATDRRRAPDFHSELAGVLLFSRCRDISAGGSTGFSLLWLSLDALLRNVVHSRFTRESKSILGHSCVMNGGIKRDGRAPGGVWGRMGNGNGMVYTMSDIFTFITIMGIIRDMWKRFFVKRENRNWGKKTQPKNLKKR